MKVTKMILQLVLLSGLVFFLYGCPENSSTTSPTGSTNNTSGSSTPTTYVSVYLKSGSVDKFKYSTFYLYMVGQKETSTAYIIDDSTCITDSIPKSYQKKIVNLGKSRIPCYPSRTDAWLKLRLTYYDGTTQTAHLNPSKATSGTIYVGGQGLNSSYHNRIKWDLINYIKFYK